MIYTDYKDFKPFPLDAHGWNGDSPVFRNLIHEIRPKNIIEVGTWKGASTISMAKVCKELGLDTKIFCVDTWLGSLEFKENERLFGKTWDRMLLHGYPQVYYQFLSNIIHTGVVDIIEPVPMLSKDAPPYLPEADLIYLDGSHDKNSVLQDLRAYWPKLKTGGIIFGDDYYLRTFDRPDGYVADVKSAVDDFFAGVNIEFRIEENNFWIVKKL